jgi:hypothetical protein
MRSAIAINASFFNTQRMVLQYLYEAYQEPVNPRDPRSRGAPGEKAPSIGTAPSTGTESR